MRNSIKAGAVWVMLLAAVWFAATAFSADTPAKEPLVLNLPPATLMGTPGNDPSMDGVEPIPEKPPVILVPKGVTNVALHKPVTSSDAPYTGELSQITDGKKDPADDNAVELKKGLQWVQVDLGAPYAIYAIAMWHDHRAAVHVMLSVIVQVSNDAEFKTNVTTLFNNDTENLSHLGAGTDREYFETRWGKVIDAKGVKARYIRGYTNGNLESHLNCWQEIEAYALPVN